jgi:hydrogenase nickel incorporation protein HypA/HybF
MHELPATRSILEVALDAARQAGARRVVAIDVVIGDLSSMLGDSVQFYFDLLSADTPAAGARLQVRRERAVANCGGCGARYEVALPLRAECAQCGGGPLGVSGGRAFYVDSVEVES